MASDVYVIQHALGPVKIGVAGNPRRRLFDLQTSCPFKLKLKKSRRCEDAVSVEKWLHNHFRKYCMGGEWFDLPRGDRDFSIPSKIENGRPDVEVPLTKERDMDAAWAEGLRRMADAFSVPRYKDSNYHRIQSLSRSLGADE